ncbi:class II aldolase/adducin family protein [Glutamicibacter mysorens]|uniref:class II aldolase/adducin family protein n=1 Tax=Glutamicibacter mysorens TaxID=257984 RepID=UPI0020C70DAF|nr:class II aldolase/adducin family protein [Glutamicibacter mysorens]UTM45830.1 class II aldolase/adducin family protein [Glutamicibacter mysorens]
MTLDLYQKERHQIALACRVLAARGLADGILGHISYRVKDDLILVRCRGVNERGLGYTEAQDIRLVDLDGNPASAQELDGWKVPNELPLHAAVLRKHLEVQSVVHAHPPTVVACDLAGIEIRPIIGAYDMPGAKLAAAGVPVHPRSVLIRNQRLAEEMVESMHDKPVVLLRGHGMTSAAASVEQAVLQAISVNVIATLSLEIVSAGGQLQDISQEDMAELPDLGSGFNTSTAWRHELARLEGVVSIDNNI